MTQELQTSLYHPGSATPPSYDHLSDTLSHESSYCALHLDAPSDMSRIERYNYHITTRNFFAWLVGTPLVGPDPVSALLDLKIRMDLWRDAGADNFGSLFQYVQEQSYGDFEDIEIEMGKRLEGEPVSRPRPYRNVSQTMEEQEKEMKRGRRASISSIGQSIRSGSQKLRRKISTTFSRTRGESQSRIPPSPENGSPPVPTLSRDVHRVMQPQIRTGSPPRPASRAPEISKTETSKPKKRESSLTRFAKRHLSWAAGPLRSDGEHVETDSGMIEPGPPGPPNGATEPSGPPANTLTALPQLPQSQNRVEAQASASPLSLRTQDLDLPAAPPNIPMRSARRLSSGSITQFDQTNNIGFSPRDSVSTSRTSLRDLSICACCGKPRKVQGIDPAKISLHNEELEHTRRGSMYSEIQGPNYGSGVHGPSHLRRRSAQRHTARHSSTHSFVSRSSSIVPSPPGLEYSSTSDSGPVSPISRDASVDPDPRGRKGYGEHIVQISSPMLIGASGFVSSPASNHSMDQMIWQPEHSREQTSGSDGSNESDQSEVKRGKKRASANSTTLGYHHAVTTNYHEATGLDMIGVAKGSGIDQLPELRGMEVVESPA